MLLQALALGGFGKLFKSLRGLWEASISTLYVPHRGSGRLWETLGASGRLWEALQGFGTVQDSLGGFGGGFRKLWEALVCFGKALGVFERF